MTIYTGWSASKLFSPFIYLHIKYCFLRVLYHLDDVPYTAIFYNDNIDDVYDKRLGTIHSMQYWRRHQGL